MKKLILTVILAFAFTMPFSGTADAYGERWYMVKKDASVWSRKRGYGVECRVSKGDRLERPQGNPTIINNRMMLDRIVGDWTRHECWGWVDLNAIYNMDTVINNLNEYAKVGETVPVFRHARDIWISRDLARSAPPLPEEIQYFINDFNTKIWDGLNHSCTLGIGSIVRITRRIGDTIFVAVDEGPQKGCVGHLPSRKVSQVERNGQWIHRAPKVCDITVGTKVHVFEDHFNGAARIKVINGPCYNKEGWILSYTIDRNKAPGPVR